MDSAHRPHLMNDPAGSSAAPLVDTHCHLAFSAFDADREAVLSRARQAGLVGIVAVAVDAPSALAALALAESEPGLVHASAGLHPTEEACGAPGAWAEVAGLLGSGRFVAVGETGLDDYHHTVPLELQRRSLDQHLGLALELDLPVILHCRDAFPAMVEALAPYRGAGLRGVLHCFTGGQAELEAMLAAGLHIGIGGVATYRTRDALRAAVRQVPADRLLLETDAPWLPPAPLRGRRNEPAFVAQVAAHLAADSGEALDGLRSRTTANARALFRI